MWWIQFLQQENEFTVTPLLAPLVDRGRHPGAPTLSLDKIGSIRGPPQGLWTLSLDEIGGNPGHAHFSLVQIRRRHCPVAADKLMLRPNILLLNFTFFIQTPKYYIFLESLWAEEFNEIVFNMFWVNQDEQDDP